MKDLIILILLSISILLTKIYLYYNPFNPQPTKIINHYEIIEKQIKLKNEYKTI